MSSGPINPDERLAIPGNSDDRVSSGSDRRNDAAGDTCEVCGSTRVSWRNCKLICGDCRSIVKSCADL